MGEGEFTGDFGGPVRIGRDFELTGWSTPGVDFRPQGVSATGQKSSTGEAPATVQFTDRRKASKKRPGPRRAALADATTYQERYAIRCVLSLATLEASNLFKLALAEDGADLSLSVDRLKEHLRQLWKLRKAREDEWGEVINLLQGVLANVVPENLTSGQAGAVLVAVRDHLAMGTVADHQPRQVRTALRDAGLDPWAPLHLYNRQGAGDAGE